MNNNSSKTTLKDLEIAIKFLNKEITVKDVEDIYGNFNDPKFQSALSEAKQLFEELGTAVKLRDLTLLRKAYIRYKYYLVKLATNAEQNVRSTLQEITKLRTSAERNLKAMRLYSTAIKRIEAKDLDRYSRLVTYWKPFFEGAIRGRRKGLAKLATKLDALNLDIQEKEAEFEEFKTNLGKAQYNIMMTQRAIYASQMQSLVNIMQGMFELVLDNIIY